MLVLLLKYTFIYAKGTKTSCMIYRCPKLVFLIHILGIGLLKMSKLFIKIFLLLIEGQMNTSHKL